MDDLFANLEKHSTSIRGEKNLQGTKRSERAPLAERMRPKSLEEISGQDHLIGEGKPLTQLQDNLPSLILWGPPGTGKTSIARLLAKDRKFRQISAVLSGVKDLRDVIASERFSQQSLVLFVDEIHRWNKAQQDALLPHIEDGSVTLIGATTENPSFSLIAPLMSRCKLFVLRPLDSVAIRSLLERALRDSERGLGASRCTIEDSAWDALVAIADGDARRGLNTLEIVASLSSEITEDLVRKVYERKTLRYDRAGDQHYDIISALIKSLRGSDPDAALYYFARMYEAGEDPKFLARRLIIFASEDIGNADPRALPTALAAADAFDRIGDAEGWIPLAQAVTYLATAPKSNASYAGYKAAKAMVEKFGNLEVPMHLRNAATKIMRELNYGKGYQYAHSSAHGIVSHEHLPKEIAGSKFYEPTARGYELRIRERMQWIAEQRAISEEDKI